MKKIYFCILLMSIAFLVPSYGACPKKNFSLEQQVVSGSVNGSTDGVFYIKIFGVNWPIPVRYGIAQYDALPAAELKLVSPSEICGNAGRKCSQEPIGIITVGSYKSYLRYYGNDLNKLDKYVETDHMASDGLSIDIRTWKPADRPCRTIQSVLIHDQDNYIKITDEDLGLWRSMLHVYEAQKRPL